MREKKTLQELTFKNNFMFGAAMLLEPENCAGVIERATGIPVSHVEIDREKSMVYPPDFKGIRLDVYARDENNPHYDVEMQVLEKPDLGKRSRYYHSQMDMELLKSGADYRELPGVIVIFICDFDPFGGAKYRYTFRMLCEEEKEMPLEDGSSSIFLSTCGKNRSEVPETLVKFLEFVHADLVDSTRDFGDEFVSRLQQAVQKIKLKREMEGQFMLWEEMIREEREEAKEEGRTEGRINAVLEIAGELGPVPEEIRQKIEAETNQEVLMSYVKMAARAGTIEEFIEKINAVQNQHI